MNVPVVRKLAQERTHQEIDEAIEVFERDRKNILNVPGGDEGEILSNLLAAQFVLHRMQCGMELNSALREYGQRVKSILGGGGSGGFGSPQTPQTTKNPKG